MTAQELHIDFDINLQKINSNITRNIEPNEKDWLLNKEVIKFLNKRTRDISDFQKRRGFEEDTKRLKDIKSLLRTVELNVVSIDERTGRVILPSFNYKDLKASAFYYKDCEESKSSSSNPIVNVFSFKLPDAGEEPIRVELTYSGEVKTIYNTENLPNDYIGGDTMRLTNSFINIVRRAFRTSEYDKIELYFEWYGETYLENTFFIVGNNKLGKVEIFFGSNTARHEVIKTVTKETVNSSAKHIEKPVRIISAETSNWKKDSFLSGSIPESPTMELEEGIGIVHFPKKTVVKKIKFTYITRPTLIDVYLGTSLDMNTDACAEVVIQTVNFTNALLGSGNYEKYFNETNLIE